MATSEGKQYCDLLTPVACDGCGGQNDVKSYCIQCPGNICDACKSTHCNIRLHRDHIILPRTHSEVVKARRFKKFYCSIHTGKEYMTYCTECSQPCCATCIIEIHDGHKFADLENTISQTESYMDKLVHDLETNLIPLSEKALSTLDEDITSYKREKDEIKQSAKERIQLLIQELFKLEDIFLTKVDTHGDKDLQIMGMKACELPEIIEKMKSTTAKAKSAPVDVSLLFLKDEISAIGTIRPSRIAYPGKISFNASSFQLPSIDDIIGLIGNDTEKILLNALTQTGAELTTSASLENRRVDVKVIGELDGISAGAIINRKNETWIINEKEKSVDIFDEHFHWRGHINIGFRCFDLAMYGSDEVIATKMDGDCLIKISSYDNITTLCSTSPLIPWGICVNNKQQIVVGVGEVEVAGEEAIQGKLQVYSSDGSSLLEETEYDQSGQPLFSGWIRRVRQTVSGEYVVACGSKIVCMSEEWKVKWTYTFGPQYNVSAVYCDRYNHILVGEEDKNEIVMLNKDGHLIRTLLTQEDGICHPFSLDVDSKGLLWIGQAKNVLISTYLI